MPVFNHTAHKDMWNWIADNFDRYTLVSKEEWPGWEGRDREPFSCFACGYDQNRRDDCSFCPLKWPEIPELSDMYVMPCVRSLYGRWEELFERWSELSSEEVAQAQEISRQIANLPVNPWVECI